MHSIEMLRSDLDYCAWADHVALYACAAMPMAELERDLGGSHRSIIATMFHIFDSQRFWFDCLRADSLPPMSAVGNNSPEIVSTEEILEELQRGWPALSSDFSDWVAGLPPEELNHGLLATLQLGDEVFLTRWQILRHMINHSTLHRGQVISMMRMLGRQPPSTDLMTFYLTR